MSIMRNQRILALLAVLLLPAAGLLHGETKPEMYKRWHDACLEGDTGKIDEQIAHYEARLAEDPEDYLAMAYLGSACALRSKHSFWGPTKLKFLKRGQAHMNTAVRSAPESYP